MNKLLIQDKKNLKQQFSECLKEFTAKIEAIKQQQGEILTELEKAQIKENDELEKVQTEVKPSSETMADLQSMVNSVVKQIQLRDEINRINQEELKNQQETITDLINSSREQLNNVNSEISRQIEKLNAWRVLQEEHSEKEKTEQEQKLVSFKKMAWIIGIVTVVLSVIITCAICYFVFKK